MKRGQGRRGCTVQQVQFSHVVQEHVEQWGSSMFAVMG